MEKIEKKLNVLEKLVKARLEFLKKGAKKTGRNQSLEFEYFELVDIVPIATEIFAEIGLLPVVNINPPEATMTVYNTDDMSDNITFTLPYVALEPIMGRDGTKKSVDIQQTGGSITYYRRYLYMVCLDIVENDSIDSQAPQEVVGVKSTTKKKPKNEEEKKKIVEKINSPEDMADELQIKGLKQALKKLKKLDPNQEEFIKGVAAKTDNLTTVTKKQCNKLLETIEKLIEEYSKDE